MTPTHTARPPCRASTLAAVRPLLLLLTAGSLLAADSTNVSRLTLDLLFERA
jgi:hypothetical protein